LIDTPWVSAAIRDFAFLQTKGNDLPIWGACRISAMPDAARGRRPSGPQLKVAVWHLLKPRSVLRDPDLVGRVEDIMAEM
jgi:hypothetical protein